MPSPASADLSGLATVKPTPEELTKDCGKAELLARLGSLIRNSQADVLIIEQPNESRIHRMALEGTEETAVVRNTGRLLDIMDGGGTSRYALTLDDCWSPSKSKFLKCITVTKSLFIGDPRPNDLVSNGTERVALRSSLESTKQIIKILLEAKKLDFIAAGGLGDDRKPEVTDPFNQRSPSGPPVAPQVILDGFVDRVSSENQIAEWDIFLTESDQKHGEGGQLEQKPGFCVVLMPGNRLPFPKDFEFSQS